MSKPFLFLFNFRRGQPIEDGNLAWPLPEAGTFVRLGISGDGGPNLDAFMLQLEDQHLSPMPHTPPRLLRLCNNNNNNREQGNNWMFGSADRIDLIVWVVPCNMTQLLFEIFCHKDSEEHSTIYSSIPGASWDWGICPIQQYFVWSSY